MRADSTSDRPTSDRRGRHALSHWLFERLVGATSLAAFVSLHVQVLGLFGSEGIVPLAGRIARVAAQPGAAWQWPTLFLALGAEDATITGLCIAGEVAATMLLVGLLPGPAALACWLFYLSFVAVGFPFLPLQWDTLLLETLLLTAIAAPWSEVLHRANRAREPAAPARWAIWFLLARLMFASGVVKIVGDEVWRDGSALDYHFWTQPLPNPVSRWAHALPRSVHALGVLFTFFAEIVTPPLFFCGRRARAFAALVTLALQATISLTGNYGFFNALTATLCVACFDDAAIARMLPVRWRASRTDARAVGRARLVVPSLLATCMATLGLFHFGTSLGAPARDEVLAILERTDPFRLASSYGLFADMTTERPELILEASMDGRAWQAYELPYKPGDPGRGLPWVGLHMPRLDWMLWFAALHESEDEVPWVRALERALLEGRAPVLALFARVPFEGRAPRYVRIVRWQYFFAHPDSDAVWERRDPRPFGPVHALR